MSTMPTRIEVNWTNWYNIKYTFISLSYDMGDFQISTFYWKKKQKIPTTKKKKKTAQTNRTKTNGLSMRSKSSLFYNIYFKLGSTNNKKQPKTIQRIHTCASSGRLRPNNRTIFACCTVWKICEQQPNTNNNKRKISSLCTVTKNHASLEENNNKIFNK